jgi:hypothetical protein
MSAVAIFPLLGKAKKMRTAIEELEAAVEGKRAESADAETRLRDKMKEATQTLERMPLAGSLVWRGRRDV